MKLTSDTTEGKIILAVTVVFCFLIIALGAAKLQNQNRLTELPVTITETTAEATTTQVTTTKPTTTVQEITVAPTTTKTPATTQAPTTTEKSTVAITNLAYVETSSYNSLDQFIITAYCPCQKCSGKWGRTTASGATATTGRTIATSSAFKFGTKLRIEGLGTYTVEDRGGAIQGNRIDIFFNTHSEAVAFGRQTRVVYKVA